VARTKAGPIATKAPRVATRVATRAAPARRKADELPVLPADHARAILLHAAGFDRAWPAGDAGIHALLDALDWIQLDPIDRVGQNADLVAGARVPGMVRGDVHRALAGQSFEHFAKERCIVHPRHFAHYRGQAVETPWWRHSERMSLLAPELLAEVLDEVGARGPLPIDQLSTRGKVNPMEWSGWKGTSRAEVLALDVLWTRCEVVVSGRDARGRRIVDTPERALPAEAVAATPSGTFAETMLLARVRSCGLLSRAGGPTWSMLAATRTDGTVERLLDAGALAEVRVGRRPYLTLPESLDLSVRDVLHAASPVSAVLGPLDPLMWNRDLVRDAFDFDYLWEIYKPEAQRRWGYYVCPLLVGGQLRGRIEARRQGKTLRIERTWGSLDGAEPALSRLAALNGCAGFDLAGAEHAE
jgi:uncharacterized protein